MKIYTFIALAVFASQASAVTDVGQILAATPTCALVGVPSGYALVTGKLDVKQGDLVVGDWRFHSFGTLRTEYGGTVGVDAYVEDTAATVEGLEGTRRRILEKC